MSKEELKQKLHRLIDEIEDERALNMLYEDAVEYKTPSNLEDDELTEERWAEVQEAMKQVANGEFITHEQLLANIKQWRSTK